MTEQESLERAIGERVEIVAYDPAWPGVFERERERLVGLCPEMTAIEHVGSTAVVGMAGKPIVDVMAAVASMGVADELVGRLCGNGYVTSAEFNATLGDRRWLMRHASGRRTHHLHLVLAGGARWEEVIAFRDRLRGDAGLAAEYVELKRRLAGEVGEDREVYTRGKGEFVGRVLRTNPSP